ncbi:MAG: hypothetical protein GW859_05590 [Sphingomonadales bacterium]|nr:hypothetical protein [Sphingomonadales bacterium]
MKTYLQLALVMLGGWGAATPALAQSDSDTKQFTVIGTVPALCAGGTIAGANATFDLGVLVDTSTGFLRTDLAAPAKTITGSFCSIRSTIRVEATPMTAQTFTAVPPSGFSRTVDYTATASGWTTTPARYATEEAIHTDATQSRATAFTGDITVALSQFSTGGGTALRLVSDPSYSGTVTVTLTAAD